MDSFHIINSSAIIQLSDPSTADLAHATWVLVIVTIISISIGAFFTIKSLNETRKSNDLTRLEMETRMKPELHLPQKHEMLMTNFANQRKHRISFSVINSGLSSANYYKSYYNLYLNKPSLQQFVADYLQNKFLRYKTTETIMPPRHGDEMTIESDKSYDEIKTCWVALWFEYTFLNNIPDERSFLIGFKNGVVDEVDIYDKNTLESIRKQIK